MQHHHHPEEETGPQHPFSWERPYFFWEGKMVNLSEAEMISLDGRLSSDLNWTKELQQARESPKRLLWKIDLGLFSTLQYPLSHEMQLHSLRLSLEHFRETVWKPFGMRSFGVILYEGSVDLARGFLWDDSFNHGLEEWLHSIGKESNDQLIRLYCRDVCVNYLHLLQDTLSDLIPAFVLLNLSSISTPGHLAQLLSSDQWQRLYLGIKGSDLPFGHFKWPSGRETVPSCTVGICIPSSTTFMEGIDEAIMTLIHHQIPFRFIPEAFLNGEWDGIDFLMVYPESISSQGKRKLQGFCAAGGTIVLLSNSKLGFSYEITFSEFLSIDG